MTMQPFDKTHRSPTKELAVLAVLQSLACRESDPLVRGFGGSICFQIRQQHLKIMSEGMEIKELDSHTILLEQIEPYPAQRTVI